LKQRMSIYAWAFSLSLALAGLVHAQTVSAGYDAAQLYNLGNDYARAGQPGLAVLSYERARLLAPRDADIESNLHRVREAARVPSEPPSELQYFKLPHPLMVAAVLLAGLLIMGLSGIAWRRTLAPARVLAGTALIGAGLAAVAASNAALVWPKLEAAVVIAAQTPVRAAPAPLGDSLFVLAEADTVNITAEHEDFVLISTLQGKTGWIPQAAVARIVPRRALQSRPRSP
jgi:hypothetical protein